MTAIDLKCARCGNPMSKDLVWIECTKCISEVYSET